VGSEDRGRWLGRSEAVSEARRPGIGFPTAVAHDAMAQGVGVGSLADVVDGTPRFVIQRHIASPLHFDFRLEIDGHLVSWAVPNGLSAEPGERRLATRTEDHPLTYLDFEGRMPDGRYGAGRVVVWDGGVAHNLSDTSLEVGLRRGDLQFWLVGERLLGGYALTQIRTRGGDRNWVLGKLDDANLDIVPSAHQLTSVLPRRSYR
jgi:DNA ligase D-like protein (predicted 3'-phosphoesterase)